MERSLNLSGCSGKIDQTTTVTNEILQENHYYPFGQALNGPWMNYTAPDNLYQYNGKELQPDHGLGWYDYGARMYMPELGRWNGSSAKKNGMFLLNPQRIEILITSAPLNQIGPFFLNIIPTWNAFLCDFCDPSSFGCSSTT